MKKIAILGSTGSIGTQSHSARRAGGRMPSGTSSSAAAPRVTMPPASLSLRQNPSRSFMPTRMGPKAAGRPAP